MNDLALIILIGLTQGFLEWLPVSSSGILTLILKYYNYTQAYDLSLLLHLGTTLAVIVKYRDIYFKPIKEGKLTMDIKRIIIATVASLPVGLVTYLISKKIVLLDLSLLSLIMGIFLIALACLIKRSRTKLHTRTVSDRDMPIVGLAQGLSTLPGISRSGVTLFTLLSLKIKNQDAVKWSFIIAPPVILGAFIFEIIQSNTLFNLNLDIIIIGNIIAFISGYISMEMFLNIARKVGFEKFSLITGLMLILSSIINLAA